MKSNSRDEISQEEWDKLCESPEIPHNEKEFKKQFKELITIWIKERQDDVLNIIREREKRFVWGGKTYRQILEERNGLEKDICRSRNLNAGGITKGLAKEILEWGGLPLKKLIRRESQKTMSEEDFISLTREVFELIGKREFLNAASSLMENVYGMAIARATKLLGLSDQSNLCIYDSRVGHYLSDLKIGSRKLVLHPPGRTLCPQSDRTTDRRIWARNYQRLIWTLEITRDYLNENIRKSEERGFLRMGEIELAFFALGRCSC